MKKFVMLMLVLGIASMANASYSIVVSDGAGNVLDSSGTYSMASPGTVWIGVYNDTAGTSTTGTEQNFVSVARYQGSAASWATNAVPWSGPHDGVATGNKLYAPPSISGAYNTYYGSTTSTDSYAVDMWHAFHAPGSPTAFVGVGVLSEFELNVTDLSTDIQIDMFDSSWFQTSSGVTLTLIPEPMTMALLGLGGLFLRRRK